MKMLPIALIVIGHSAWAQRPLTLEHSLRGAARALHAHRETLEALEKAPVALSFDAARCAPESAADPKIYAPDFKWGYTHPEMVKRFSEMYESGKRLPKRAFWNEAAGRLELPYDAERGGNIVLPESFARSVARHIVSAFRSKYIDGVFFPDMGHSHFLIPQAHWDQNYRERPNSEMSRMFEDLFADPKLEVLYHTAEQLTTRNQDGTLVADERTQFRYRTRNIVGNNSDYALKVPTNPTHNANTVDDVPGYFWWGGGFNISAVKTGCFAVRVDGRELRFDLSMYDLEYPPGVVIADPF